MFDTLRSIDRRLSQIVELLQAILEGEYEMSQATDNLATAVRRETDVVSSVTTLISGLAAQIKQTSDDPQVQALADQINANSDTLANAVTANTPAAPEGQAGGAQTTGDATG
jgi:predicted HAD superfamily Cof-like phosphohydrolase